METAKSKWRIPLRTLDSERILEEYYGKLQQWGVVLSRGDRTLAQEIVHDLCVHFILAKPDLSAVANLDGYLYTCLRHIYLSALARSSREALQTVNVADFDSVQFALNAYFSDSLLDRQNELRRICNYAVWRKGSSKSASYFLLLFFHGYTRREVAEIAQLPLAAIYNKLKVAREELTAHLKASIRPRIASRDVPPNPELHVSTVSSAVLFRELRAIIFEARSSECLPEETLLAQYRTTIPKPVPCGLLSHIVSCERCLSLLDRHFRRPTSEDREPPGSPSDRERGEFETAGHDAPGYHAMMSSLRRERGRIYEHRPQTLSIAINGKIVAFHDVKSERSTLASRAERPEAVQFVEVFTDQQIRLALLPIEELPPGGSHAHTQAVALSDGRLMELTVCFDGQGLHSEVTYLDPALAAVRAEDDQDENCLASEADLALSSSPALQGRSESKSITNWIARAIHILTPRTALAWAVVLVAMVGSAGYLAYRYTQPSLDARAVLSDSVKIEAAETKGATEHQVLELDALGENGQAAWQGTVHVWQEPSGGRTMRRLYNAQHQFIAAEWRGQNGKNNSFEAPAGGTVTEADHRVAESGFWKADISARGFEEIAAQHIDIRTVSNNYELTGSGLSSGPIRLVSATLILNHRLHFVGETLHMTHSYEFTEARFVEASEDHLPAASVPDSVFELSDLGSRMQNIPNSLSVQNGSNIGPAETDPRLVQTEIAALYQLNQLNLDVGVPIEISRTPNGHIRVAGAIASEALKSQIVAALANVSDHQLLEIHLVTEGSIRMPIPPSRLTSPPTDVYDIAPVEPPASSTLRKYFAAKGLPGKQIDSAVTQFSHDALDHAQHALQNAYALDRLGSSFSAKELRSIGPVAQQQWSAMAARHSSALETELDELRQQLAPLNLAGHPVSSRRQFCKVDDPADFAGCARRLLLQTQDLNRAVGDAFSSGLTGAMPNKGDDLIDAASESIPLNDAKQLAEFTSHLANTNDSANSGVERYSRQ